MAATRAAKKPLASRTNCSAVDDVAELATKLASRLKIADSTKTVNRRTKNAIVTRQKDKKVQEVSPEETKASSMRNVNSVLQILSSAIKSGWKASTARRGVMPSSTSIASSVSSALESIAVLRKMSPGVLDVERAALSIAGKLLALEMHDCAINVLNSVQIQLATYYQLRDITLSANIQVPVSSLILPLPTESSVLDLALQTLIVTYFTHALTIAAHAITPKASLLGTLSKVLDEPGCLASWIPYLPDLPSKSVDALLKRFYSVITSSITQVAAPRDTLHVRFIMLRWLLLCVEMDFKSYWEQCLKFAASYARSDQLDRTELERASDLVSCFCDVVKMAESRQDKTLILSGKGWISFCEYWMCLAKQAGDISLLKRVVSYIQTAASTSSQLKVTPGAGEPLQKNDELSSKPATPEDASLLSSHLCASFIRTIAIIESFELSKDIYDEQSIETINASTSGIQEVLSVGRMKTLSIDRKYRRALEKLRRVCTKTIVNLKTGDKLWISVKLLLEEIVKATQCLLNVDTQEGAEDCGNQIVSILDALFCLASSSLVPHRIETSDLSFDYLRQASAVIERHEKILQSCKQSNCDTQIEALLNYKRCLSGAFFNTAGSLYKSEKYGAAVRFLQQGCSLATDALNAYNSEIVTNESTKGKGRELLSDNKDKEREAWRTHKFQLHRRWELLGVCSLKIGDRKLAYDAFVRGVVSFPVEEYIQDTEKTTVYHDLSSDDCLQFATMIDRLTYIAAAELYLGGKASLMQPLQDAHIPKLCTGSILIRQVQSLGDSRWKPAIREVVGHLLRDLVSIYGSQYPIRRSRALVLQLEHMYYGDANLNIWQVETVVRDIQSILSVDDLCDDKHLSGFRSYIILMARLWHILLMHRLGEPLKSILEHVNDSIAFINLDVLKRKSERKGTEVSTKSGTLPVSKPTRQKTATRQTVRKTPAKKTAAVLVTTNGGKSPGARVQNTSHSDEIILTPNDLTDLIDLLKMTAELSGILGLSFPKMQFQLSTLHLLESLQGSSSSAYRGIVADFSYELLRIGKVEHSINVLSPFMVHLEESTLDLPTSLLYLNYAEALASSGDLSRSLTLYESISQHSADLYSDEKKRSTSQRIQQRIRSFELSSVASRTCASIQFLAGDFSSSLNSLLQALRLLNKAVETLSKLSASTDSSTESTSDPFAMSELKDALPSDPARQTERLQQTGTNQSTATFHGLEWRIASMLLDTMLSLSDMYYMRGSPREAEYFVEQAEDLSRVLGSDVLLSRMLIRRSEIQLYIGHTDKSRESLKEAQGLLKELKTTEAIDANRLEGNYLQRIAKIPAAQNMYIKATDHLLDFKSVFSIFSNPLIGLSPSRELQASSVDSFMPLTSALILKQRVWIHRDDIDNGRREELLQELLALPRSLDIETQVNMILGRLALHDIHSRFRSDISLNSLAESTIALPMGMTCEKSSLSSPAQDVMEALEQAEELFSSCLQRLAQQTNVLHTRSSAVSAALISIYQASLGKANKSSSISAALLLDMSPSITLRRELIEAISFKFPDSKIDDLQWPRVTNSSNSLMPVGNKSKGLFDNLSDDDEEIFPSSRVRKYWDHVSEKYQRQMNFATDNSQPDISHLPDNWLVLSIVLTEDRNALLITRQRPHQEPFILCNPLRGRRDDDDDEHFTFDDAMTELAQIIKESDDSTKQASKIDSNDKEGKAAWWAERKKLDQRLQELIANIEFCWLGAFKTIFCQPMRTPPDAISNLRSRLEKIFKGIFSSHERKAQKVKWRLENSLVELFSFLPATCRDEELEDFVYFVLDLYHFHGAPIAFSEVDIDVVVVDLRSVLEEHHSRTQGRVIPEPDIHMFLVLDKNVQGIPWESLPILRGRSVSRIPSISFITDRLALARCRRGLPFQPEVGKKENINRIDVDPSKAYYVLNPSGDLVGTEKRFRPWLEDMKRFGWDGVIGQTPSEQQFLNALERKDLVIYFGHGGAEQYARSHKIRHLQRCAATMLWGCSSGALREMGDFDRIGTPNNYMLAGCPTLIANLWDVTDRDIDKFAQAVFDKMNLVPGSMNNERLKKSDCEEVSIVAAVAQSRDVCKLKYLTGAAVVVYGIPFYL